MNLDKLAVTLPADTTRVAVVADTHSSPHPSTAKLLRAYAPDAILHAGDIGDLAVLDDLAAIAPVHAIRGNIDSPGSARARSTAEWRCGDAIDSRGAAPARSTAEWRCGDAIDGRGLPDVLVIDLGALRILLVHIGVAGPRLRGEVARMARAEKAQLVICGHSHVPFIGVERGLSIFNPGSIGPRRFALPIVFGTLELRDGRVRLAHVDAETGAAWSPPG